MKKLIPIIFIFSVLLCGCGHETVSSSPQSAENTKSTEVLPEKTESAGTDKIEIQESAYIRRLTVDELNRINVILSFTRSDGVSPVRALLSDTFADSSDIDFRRFIDRLSFESLYSDMYLDSENPYLTAEDTDEIQYLKENGFDFDYEGIENGTLRLGRIPYHTAEEILNKYAGVSTEQIIDKSLVKYSEKYGVFYTSTDLYCGGFKCVEGRLFTDRLELFSADWKKAVLKKFENGYRVDSVTPCHEEIKDTYKQNGTDYYNFALRDKEIYLKYEADKGAEYNRAVSAFNDRLLSLQSENSPPYDLNRYALMDITGDGVPELIKEYVGYNTGYTAADIYCNDRVMPLEMPWESPGHGSFEILSDGMIASRITNTEVTWSFYRYASDGTVSKTVFVDGYDRFYYNGTQVTQAEFEKLTADYIALYEKTAALDWQDYYEPVAYIRNDGYEW